ncbi:hypothetical protein GLOTRDRAFT_112550 [Gloeophyllum trabeum ATCC 11539]|uniref:Uncharacterized protein n=1 Tax=Gloeophyllum trabeum (strain ATCC 11539 / FP-39264 / Madison 617) TaxID=670483 RepID=S7PUL4_GLOTA|nr:uncharacterized protein GLOTRDRAFT_112550 [Gloeophyllum trabeum ATCC 11539]EPQ51078.1 hypothetical protein GLOTRDRAFT_112550 [Gloeophyllum trabeum ATCC 11539]
MPPLLSFRGLVFALGSGYAPTELLLHFRRRLLDHSLTLIHSHTPYASPLITVYPSHLHSRYACFSFGYCMPCVINTHPCIIHLRLLACLLRNLDVQFLRVLTMIVHDGDPQRRQNVYLQQ